MDALKAERDAMLTALLEIEEDLEADKALDALATVRAVLDRVNPAIAKAEPQP